MRLTGLFRLAQVGPILQTRLQRGQFAAIHLKPEAVPKRLA